MTRKVVSKHGMAAAIAALALAGCGAQAGTSGASPAAPSVGPVATPIRATGGPTEPSPPPHRPPACRAPRAGPSGPAPAAPSVAQVATRIGATGVTTDPSPTLYASHEGSATWHGQSVDIATFADDTLRNSWESVAKTFGPILADGHDYAVTTG